MSGLVRAVKTSYITVGALADYPTTKLQTALDRAAEDHTTVLLKMDMTAGSDVYLVDDYCGLEAVHPSIKITLPNGANRNIIQGADSTNGVVGVHIRNITLDQNGVNQTSGAALRFTGLMDSLFENVTCEKAYNFCMFVDGVAGTSLTGTLTFTNNDTTVTGSGTSFTTELAVGDIIKSNGGHFQRVESIASNTSLELDRKWGWATETGVAAKRVPANARNRIINPTFNGTVVNDNCGLGLFDDGKIIGGITRFSGNYGLGPDHCNRLQIIGLTSEWNTNAAIGMETCGDCVVDGGNFSRSAKGVYLLSGSYRNILKGFHTKHNTGAGVEISYNTTSFPHPDGNTLDTIHSSFNGTHGFRIGGASRTAGHNLRGFNNNDYGFVTVTENSRVPNLTSLLGGHFYDDQDVKTQDRGVYLLNSTNALMDGFISLDADHNTAGYTDSGTGTTLGTIKTT